MAPLRRCKIAQGCTSFSSRVALAALGVPAAAEHEFAAGADPACRQRQLRAVGPRVPPGALAPAAEARRHLGILHALGCCNAGAVRTCRAAIFARHRHHHAGCTWSGAAAATYLPSSWLQLPCFSHPGGQCLLCCNLPAPLALHATGGDSSTRSVASPSRSPTWRRPLAAARARPCRSWSGAW